MKLFKKFMTDFIICYGLIVGVTVFCVAIRWCVNLSLGYSGEMGIIMKAIIVGFPVSVAVGLCYLFNNLESDENLYKESRK